MNFEEYLISKKIDASAFAAAEPSVFEKWKLDFEQMHPNSFTVQKLNLINPIRRKYHLKVVEAPAKTEPAAEKQAEKQNPIAEATPAAAPPIVAKPAVSRPIMKPKIN
ncbi:hypothetical protein [Chryseosolibacter indicus]|uniref:Uncharacterized protein n=1 Tax=Chryseosolibacter indicus TaxID=2782351 RepID=A0ABS5VTG3_9BACT|nr:hypothetical protein [Chryseosolibacter indicus]MBT1704348.1 hypothetical protein [Chryseosolibacter indicus]